MRCSVYGPAARGCGNIDVNFSHDNEEIYPMQFMTVSLLVNAMILLEVYDSDFVGFSVSKHSSLYPDWG